MLELPESLPVWYTFTADSAFTKPGSENPVRMKISKMTDYGVLVLNHLADAGGIKQSTDVIANALSLSVPTVRKVLKILVDTGLVQARRGAHGGYRLTRSPDQITLLNVVEAFEGPLHLTECSVSETECDITNNCSLSENWGGINQIVAQLLAAISLSDIRNPSALTRLTQVWQNGYRIPLLNLV